jgi:hypothetical protein
LDGDYLEGGRWMYILHPLYAPDATHYLRAFSILQGDLLRLFEYIEPADGNEATYSFRCLELLIRACGEVEANCRVILEQNGYAGGGRWTMKDYVKLEKTHRLSSYRVRLPVWTGAHGTRQPFADWKSSPTLPWFQAHHSAKHNRHTEFNTANLGHAIDAVAGVLVLLSAQFITHDFGPVVRTISLESEDPEFEDAIGGYFRVGFPNDWSTAECYNFDWQALRTDRAPFATLTF